MLPKQLLNLYFHVLIDLLCKALQEIVADDQPVEDLSINQSNVFHLPGWVGTSALLSIQGGCIVSVSEIGSDCSTGANQLEAAYGVEQSRRPDVEAHDPLAPIEPDLPCLHTCRVLTAFSLLRS